MPCISVVVQKKYPLLFLEKRHDGTFITRNESQEEYANRLFEV